MNMHFYCRLFVKLLNKPGSTWVGKKIFDAVPWLLYITKTVSDNSWKSGCGFSHLSPFYSTVIFSIYIIICFCHKIVFLFYNLIIYELRLPLFAEIFSAIPIAAWLFLAESFP